MAQSTEILLTDCNYYRTTGFFKLGQDSVLLSAFAKPRRNAKLLDLGCGTGALALLVWRPDLKITGLELQDGPLDLFRQSIAANELENVTALQGDLRQMRTLLPHGSMDYVICNPPYFDRNAGANAPTADAPQGRTRPVRLRTGGLRPRSCCIPAAKPRSYSGRNGCGCCSRRFRACGSCRKNAVRAPERAGGAKRRHGRVPKRRQCGRTCC